MLHVNDACWGRYMQIAVSRGAINISLTHRGKDTALLYHFVAAISPFLAIEPTPRYLAVKPLHRIDDDAKAAEGKASIQYALKDVSDFNTITMPTVLILLISEIESKDLNARTTSGEEYYGHFEKTAFRSHSFCVLIPPRTLMGSVQQLTIDDLFIFDGVQIIRSYHETQAISAMRAVMHAYHALRLRLTAMQKQVIKTNEMLIAQRQRSMAAQEYNSLDFCEDSCMRQASAELAIPNRLDNSDDLRTCIEEENISILPIQYKYLYHADPSYQYLQEVERKKKEEELNRVALETLTVASSREKPDALQPKTLVNRFRKQFLKTKMEQSDLATQIDKLSVTPSFAQTCFNIQSICSEAQALSSTSGRVGFNQEIDGDSDDSLRVLEGSNLSLSDNHPNSPHHASVKLKGSTNTGHTQLTTSHATSVAGLASAVHAFEDPFDPQSSVFDRTTSVRIISRPPLASAEKKELKLHSTTQTSVFPLDFTLPDPSGSYNDLIIPEAPLSECLEIEEWRVQRRRIMWNDRKPDTVAVSADNMNRYNGILLDLHFRVNRWEELDICQRIELVKDMIRALYLPAFCHICYRDRTNFRKKQQPKPVSDTNENIENIHLPDNVASGDDGESLEDILAEYRREFAKKKLLKEETRSAYRRPPEDEHAVFRFKSRPGTQHSSCMQPSRSVSRQPPSILSKPSLDRCATSSTSRSISSQPRTLSPMKHNRPASLAPRSTSNITPCPTIIESTYISEHADDLAPTKAPGEQKGGTMARLQSQMVSFITYCKLSRNFTQYIPTIREALTSYIDTVSTTASFEVEPSAHYCSNCSIFMGCCKRCADIFYRSHQSDCANFVAFKIFSHMNDRQLESCCRFEEGHVPPDRAKIDSLKALHLRKQLQDFDQLATQELAKMQQYMDEKPKVVDGESDIIKDYREQRLGCTSYTDSQIHSIREQGDVILTKIQDIKVDKHEKYGAVQSSFDTASISEELAIELNNVLQENNPNAMQNVLRKIFEQRRQLSDTVVEQIKEVDAHNSEHERGLTVFFTHLIDLLRSQYQLSLDELHTQQEQAMHERFLAVAADLRLCSLLEILKQDILGMIGRLSQKRFNPVISDHDMILSSKQKRSWGSGGIAEWQHKNIYSAMSELAEIMVSRAHPAAKRPRDSSSRANAYLRASSSDQFLHFSDVTDSRVSETDSQMDSDVDPSNQVSPRESVADVNAVAVTDGSSEKYPARGVDSLNVDSRADLQLSTEFVINPQAIQRNTIGPTECNIASLQLPHSFGSISSVVHGQSNETLEIVDPYREYLLKQLPKHMKQGLMTAERYLGFRSPSSTVTLFPQDVYDKIGSITYANVIFALPMHALFNVGAGASGTQGSALANNQASDDDADNDTPLGYEEMTYNSIYMIQPDILMAVSELQQIMGRAELLYDDAAAILAQYSAQVRLQHKIMQMKSAIKKELYSAAKTARRENGGGRGENIKITNQEVEYTYMKRYGYDIRKFVFSFPQSHSELLYTDTMESMKAIMDSLLPLYQYTQTHLSKLHSGVQRLDRTVKDKRVMYKKVSTNLDKIVSTKRSLDELATIMELQLRQKQHLFERALSASPSPGRENRERKSSQKKEFADISLPRLSIKDLCPTSASMASSTRSNNEYSQSLSVSSSTVRAFTSSAHTVYLQGLAPAPLGGAHSSSHPFHRSVHGSSHHLTPSLGPLSPHVYIDNIYAYHHHSDSHVDVGSPHGLARHTSQRSDYHMSFQRSRETRSEADSSHPATVRAIARRMHRGGRQVKITGKKIKRSPKGYDRDECSDYEFSPENLLGLSSITGPSDRQHKEISTTDEQVDMADYACRKLKRRPRTSLSKRTSTETGAREMFSASEVADLFRPEEHKSSVKSTSGNKKAPSGSKRNASCDAPRHQKAKKSKSQHSQSSHKSGKDIESLKDLWKPANTSSSRRPDLFSSSSDTELSTLAVVTDVTRELDYMEQINPPISDIRGSPPESGLNNELSETAMQIQRDLHKLSPDILSSVSPRKIRTNIPPRSHNLTDRRTDDRELRYSRGQDHAQLDGHRLPPFSRSPSPGVAHHGISGFKQIEMDFDEAAGQSVLASLGSCFFTHQEVSTTDEISGAAQTAKPAMFVPNGEANQHSTINVAIKSDSTRTLPSSTVTNKIEDIRCKSTDAPLLMLQLDSLKQLPPPTPSRRRLERQAQDGQIDFVKLNLSGLYKKTPNNDGAVPTSDRASVKMVVPIASDPIPGCAEERTFKDNISRLNKTRFHDDTAARRRRSWARSVKFGITGPAYSAPLYAIHEDKTMAEKSDAGTQLTVLEKYKMLRQTYSQVDTAVTQRPVVDVDKPQQQRIHHNGSSKVVDPIKLIAKLQTHSKITASPHTASKLRGSQKYQSDGEEARADPSLSSSDDISLSDRTTIENSATLIGVTNYNLAATRLPDNISEILMEQTPAIIDPPQSIVLNKPELPVFDPASNLTDTSSNQKYRFMADSCLSASSTDSSESGSETMDEPSPSINATVRKIQPAVSTAITRGIAHLNLSKQEPPPQPAEPRSQTGTRRKVHVINLPGIPIRNRSAEPNAPTDAHIDTCTADDHSHSHSHRRSEVLFLSALSNLDTEDKREDRKESSDRCQSRDTDKLSPMQDESHAIKPAQEDKPEKSTKLAQEALQKTDVQKFDTFVDRYNRLRLGAQEVFNVHMHTMQLRIADIAIGQKWHMPKTTTIYDIIDTPFNPALYKGRSEDISLKQRYAEAHRELNESNIMLDLFVDMVNDIYLFETPVQAFKQLVTVRNDLSKYRSRGLQMIMNIMTAQSLEVPKCAPGDFTTFIKALNLFTGNRYPFDFSNYAIVWCNFIVKYMQLLKHVDFLIANCIAQDISMIDRHTAAPFELSRTTISTVPSTIQSGLLVVPRFDFKGLSPVEKRLYVGSYSLVDII